MTNIWWLKKNKQVQTNPLTYGGLYMFKTVNLSRHYKITINDWLQEWIVLVLDLKHDGQDGQRVERLVRVPQSVRQVWSELGVEVYSVEFHGISVLEQKANNFPLFSVVIQMLVLAFLSYFGSYLVKISIWYLSYFVWSKLSKGSFTLAAAVCGFHCRLH